jgi:hypothetical protein
MFRGGVASRRGREGSESRYLCASESMWHTSNQTTGPCNDCDIEATGDPSTKARDLQKFQLSVLNFSSCVLEAQEQDMRSVSMLFEEC